MGSCSPNSYFSTRPESNLTQKSHPTSNEQKGALHNHEETKTDDRSQANRLLTTQLGEFFPLKWLVEITGIFQQIKELGVKTYTDRVAAYLGYIEVCLTFRGLVLLNSTLVEITKSLGVKITKPEVRCWRVKLLRSIPRLKAKWVQIRTQTHQTALVSTVIQVMNQEFTLTKYTQEEIFQIKQEVLRLAQKYAVLAKHIKKPEEWARAICLKALHTLS